MTINKFTGKTIEEAIEKAKKEMGEDCVIMNDRQVKPKGFFSLFKQSYFEVTAAIEGDEAVESAAIVSKAAGKDTINLSADEEIKISPVTADGANNTPDNAGVYSRSSIRNTAPKVSKTSAYAPVNPAAAMKKETRASKNEEEPLLVDLLSSSTDENDDTEEKLQKLNNILAQSISSSDKNKNVASKKTSDNVKAASDKEMVEAKATKSAITLADIGETDENIAFLKLLYNSLIQNEVDERYANSLLDDVMKGKGMSVGIDYFLSNIYQKMVLKFGNPNPIRTEGKKPGIVFFIGPTGVGKTTTIAKLASKFSVELDKKVALITADTYRIAATDQLAKYAEIIKSPLRIIYSPEELLETVESFADYDLVLIDTAGFSHKNESQRQDTKALIDIIPENLRKSVYLVLSSTTKYRDLKDICEMYKSISDYSLIFTKLDETEVYGNLYNIKQYTGAEISYITNGQNVPGDMLEFNPQDIVKTLLRTN